MTALLTVNCPLLGSTGRLTRKYAGLYWRVSRCPITISAYGTDPNSRGSSPAR
ncbi:hypothetical protein M201_gp68 [Haloarcula californiae tailed virus 2]|uniref:Uncharacterized protein n=1 Tax=Haloarcula californiae tailed virus 2 TaxID=1273747 RepID=R4TMB1_9CAUD|nr:hypothetical protein M201_gp68 [Haloarcula californiae tailed virus 2]AGM11862.1 hypothetical protein HCTV2_76 [Haloarcula californiae tailed virus 2]